jgi:hypothetical protein
MLCRRWATFLAAISNNGVVAPAYFHQLITSSAKFAGGDLDIRKSKEL